MSLSEFIEDISFETSLREEKNRTSIIELRKFGAKKRLLAGVFDTPDSRELLTDELLIGASKGELEDLLEKLQARHKAECNWIRLCNSGVLKNEPRTLPEDTYSTIVENKLREICSDDVKPLNVQILEKLEKIDNTTQEINTKLDEQYDSTPPEPSETLIDYLQCSTITCRDKKDDAKKRVCQYIWKRCHLWPVSGLHYSRNWQILYLAMDDLGLLPKDDVNKYANFAKLVVSFCQSDELPKNFRTSYQRNFPSSKDFLSMQEDKDLFYELRLKINIELTKRT